MSTSIPSDAVDCVVKFRGDPIGVQYRVSAVLHHSSGRILNLRGDGINVITNVPERVLQLVRLPFKPVVGAVYKVPDDGNYWVYCLDEQFRRLSYMPYSKTFALSQQDLIEKHGMPELVAT